MHKRLSNGITIVNLISHRLLNGDDSITFPRTQGGSFHKINIQIIPSETIHTRFDGPKFFFMFNGGV